MTSTTATKGPGKTPGVLTGGKVLAMLIAFFGVMFAVNGYMAYKAVATFRGADTDSVFSSGKAFPAEMEAARRQTALNWAVTLHAGRDSQGRAAFTMTPLDATGAPLTGLNVQARLEHPSDRYLDQSFVLAEGQIGVYAGFAGTAKAGTWDLVVEASRGGERLYRTKNRVSLP